MDDLRVNHILLHLHHVFILMECMNRMLYMQQL